MFAATGPEVALLAPGPVAGLGVDPLEAEVAGDLAVTGTWCQGLPQGDIAGASERQAYVVGDGRVAEGFVPQGGATAGSLAEVGATPGCGTLERAAAPPAVSLYARLPMPAPGTTFIDHGRMPERELGPFELPHPPLPHVERPPTPGRHWAVPAMVDAQTTTTTTVTSTIVTPAAIMEVVYPSYTGYMPSTGLDLAPPIQPAAVVSQNLPTVTDTAEGLPEAWTGPAGRHAEF